MKLSTDSDSYVEQQEIFAGEMISRIAHHLKEAGLKDDELIKNDISLKSMMVNNPTCTPKVYVEDVSVAKWWKKSGGKGYSFYQMDAD